MISFNKTEPRSFILGLAAALIIAGLAQIVFIALDNRNASKDIKQCTDVGGQPIYDLCAKHIEIIKLPGVEYAPEVDEYK